MLVKTKAIVLKTIDYSESSIIATLFTLENGKVAVIAKGARKPKSKFAAFLVPGQLVEAVFYFKQSRSVQTLSDISYTHKLHSLRVDMEKMALTMSAMELTGQVLHESEVNPELYQFLETFLNWADKQESTPALLFPYMQLRIAEHIGVGLQPTNVEGDNRYGYLNIRSGTLSVESEDEHSEKLTASQFAFVKKTLHSANASVLRIVMNPGEIKKLISILDRYFTFHIEGIKPRKSDKIFEQLLMK